MKDSKQKQIFEDWLSAYKALLFKVVRAYAFTAIDQDDLFQEISIQVWHSIPKFRGESSPATWIYRVSLNTAIRWSKRANRHSGSHQSIEGEEHLLEQKSDYVDERLSWLYDEIAQLDEIDKSLTLLLLDGFSYKEMAAMLGISESNIGVKIHRIKKHLTTQSKKYDYHGV